jgi:hypothetical protein
MAGLVGMFAAKTLAAPINYGDKPAATVDYLQVTEDTNSFDDAPPKFGMPSIAGDTMDFDPFEFNAKSSNGSVADITDGQLNFGIVAHAGKIIKNVGFTEAGDTTLAGVGTDATFTSVTSHFNLDVIEIDGHAPTQALSLTNVNLAFSPSGGTYGLGTDGLGGPFFTAGWNGSVLVDVNAYLASKGEPFVGGATKVKVALDNTLVATSQTGTSSFIAKKDADGVTITVNKPVPEPTACLMAVLGLAGGLAVSRRRA